jgi:hypothetical protein
MDNSAERAAAVADLPGGFHAGAQYFSAMDCAIYLKEDCSYRAARVSPALSLLLAPYEDRVVGVKIKGVRHLAERLFSILEKSGRQLDEANRVELRALLQMACVSDEFAERALSEADLQRRHQMAARANQFLAEAESSSIEVPVPALAA